MFSSSFFSLSFLHLHSFYVSFPSPLYFFSPSFFSLSLSSSQYNLPLLSLLCTHPINHMLPVNVKLLYYLFASTLDHYQVPFFRLSIHHQNPSSTFQLVRQFPPSSILLIKLSAHQAILNPGQYAVSFHLHPLFFAIHLIILTIFKFIL